MKHIIWSSAHKLHFNNIVDSDNCFLFDSSGNRFIDLESGVWCTSVGHNNKRINDIIVSQINRITHTGFIYCHPQIDAIAKKVLEITGFQHGKCEFLSSGSEAVEYGMRIARTLSVNTLTLAFSDSYYGAYGDAATKTDQRWYVYDRLNCSCNHFGSGCIGECKEFDDIPFEKIGIFLFEPGSSSGLVRFPSPKLISKIVSKIKGNNGIVMVNEITTGIGRTGKWFGYQHYNILPDIVAIGKGIGNGYPVSIVAIVDTIAEKINNSGFTFSQSHQNDPLGAFIANEVIDIIMENNLINIAASKGKYLKESLLILKEEFPIIQEIRGRGMMLAIEFISHAEEIYEDLLNHRFIVAKRPNAEVLRIDPALTVEKEILDLFLASLREALKKKTKNNI